jgi:hypothetical protein
MTPPAAEEPQTTPLMEYILAVLAPLLIVGSITDLRLARLAAREAIDAYKARNTEELLTIAQIAGLAIAALDNLRLSASEDLSVSLKLKLRGNAAALNRAGQKTTADLHRLRQQPPPLPGPEDDATARDQAEKALEAARAALRQAEAPHEPQADRRHALAWAAAKTDVAAEFSAGLDTLPPPKRRAAMARINVLAQVARDISKTGLLSTTSLSQTARLLETSATPVSTAATKPTMTVASA